MLTRFFSQFMARVFSSLTHDLTQLHLTEPAIEMQPSNKRLRLLANALPVCLAYIDVDQRYRFVNKTYEEWFHCTRSELYGKSVSQVIGENAYAVVRPYIEQALAGHAVEYEARVPYERGGTRYINAMLSPDFDSQQQVKGYFALITDISQRKQVELALTQSEARFATIFRANPIASSLSTYPDGLLLDVNETWCHMFGYHRDEVLGRTTEEIGLWHQQRDRADALQQLEQQGTIAHLEVQFCTKAGDVRDGLASLEIVEVNGDRCMLLMILDITQQKQAEANLRASEERFRLIFENASVGVALVNEDGTVVAVNDADCRFLGYPKQELIGMHFSEFTHADDIALDAEQFAALIAGNHDSYTVDKRYIRKDGSIVWGALTVSLIRETDGSVRYIVAVCKDISDRKQAEAALRQQAERERLLRTITQRIRQSLDLDQILVTAVTEVRQTLHADRTLIFRLNDDGSGSVIQESVQPPYASLQAMQWTDEYLLPDWYEYYRQGNVRIVANVPDRWAPYPTGLPQNADVKSKIVAAITQNTKTGVATVWGLLIVHACGDQRQWHLAEADLLQQISHQLAIAIDHANHHQQLQRELAERQKAEQALQHALAREQQVLQRERFIAAIAQHIRESLDLSQILTTTVEEVQQFLQADRVIFTRIEPEQDGIVAAEAVKAGYPSMQNSVIHKDWLHRLITVYRKGGIRPIADIETATFMPAAARDYMRQHQIQALLTVPILWRDQVLGLLSAHQCHGLYEWQPFEVALLEQLATQVAIGIHQANLYQQTQQQAQTQLALNRVIQSIRNSLDFATIFPTAATEIGNLLQADRVTILQYIPDRSIWLNIADHHKDPSLPSVLGLKIPDKDNPIAAQLKQLKIVQVDDAQLSQDAYVRACAELFPGAWLVVPLSLNGSVWGNLGVIRINVKKPWQTWEVELVQSVVAQLAIAIQQSELYQQVQQLNTHLEEQVEERTAQLQQAFEFEATLKRITDRVRDSLDENQILQSAVEELARTIGVNTCNAGLYDLDTQTSTIRFEYTTTGQPLCHDLVVQMADFPEGYDQLLQGQYFQFCSNQPHSLGGITAVLACPILDDQGVLGDLWLIHQKSYGFSNQDLGLVQQVSNQCAIAIRQSRLYQESQAQIAELEQLNLLKDDFLSSVSHELRTPMSSIKMAIQMLEMILFKADSAQTNLNSHLDLSHSAGALSVNSALASSFQRASRYFQILKDECQREINLIDDLLDLTRLDAGTDLLVLSPIEPVTLLPDIITPFAERITSQQQQLQLDIPLDLPPLMTDRSSFERIIIELLNNACKYTPPGETITVAAQATAAGLQIRVSNSGIEIPDAEHDRIFEKFYRIPKSDRWKHGGTGLGLALVKKLVEQLEGSIQVESSSGQTSFVLHLQDLKR